MISKSKIIGAVEIGTAKVAVLVGEISNGRALNIVGMGQCSSRGVIKGEVVDFKAASDCTHAAILAAEQQAGVRVDGVYLAQTGGHLTGFYNEAGVTVSAVDNRVDGDDIAQVTQLAKQKELPADRTVIHHIRRPFKLDGRIVPDPEYMEGKKLEVGYWTVHGQASKVSDHIHIINGFSLHVDDIILASLASGSMVATAEEKSQGVLVIDIGRGTTDYALYRDGCCYLAGVVPVGGDHLTNDLSIALRLTTNQAESLKIRYGRGLQVARDKSERVWLNGDLAIGDRQIPRMAIDQVLALRVAEIFEVVKKSLGASYRPDLFGGGVILTGGTSRLPMIDQAASRIFGAPIRLGENPGWANEQLSQPEYSTVLGLLHYGLNYHNSKSRDRGRSTGIFRRFSRMFASA